MNILPNFGVVRLVEIDQAAVDSSLSRSNFEFELDFSPSLPHTKGSIGQSGSVGGVRFLCTDSSLTPYGPNGLSSFHSIGERSRTIFFLGKL